MNDPSMDLRMRPCWTIIVWHIRATCQSQSKVTNDFSLEDITFSGGNLGTLSGSGDTYYVNFTPTSNGEKNISVAADTFTDEFGNKNTESNTDTEVGKQTNRVDYRVDILLSMN